jgi:hypothetical protein
MSSVYQAMTVAGLAGYLASAQEDGLRWRLVAEFLEEYRHERHTERARLRAAAHGRSALGRFLAVLARTPGPAGTGADVAEQRQLRTFWFPCDTRAARADAIVHAPATFRRRGSS